MEGFERSPELNHFLNNSARVINQDRTPQDLKLRAELRSKLAKQVDARRNDWRSERKQNKFRDFEGKQAPLQSKAATSAKKLGINFLGAKNSIKKSLGNLGSRLSSGARNAFSSFKNMFKFGKGQTVRGRRRQRKRRVAANKRLKANKFFK
jgi:hypothetical protein